MPDFVLISDDSDMLFALLELPIYQGRQMLN